jgi:integrase
MALVSMALEEAADSNLIERNPAKLKKPKKRGPAEHIEVKIMEPEEYERLLNRVQGTRYYALVVFAAASGCRRGEMLALQWRDIDLATGEVKVSKSLCVTKTSGREIKRTKSDKSRRFHVSPATIEVLLSHKRERDAERVMFGADYQENDLVFPALDGDYYQPDRITGRIAEFMREVGVEASLHSLRHFHASMLLSQNVPITAVSKRLGHADSSITLRVYSHAMKADEDAAGQSWDNATADILARTRKPAESPRGKLSVIFCDPGRVKKAVND